ncbi:hypothetical protein QAD02_000396 [Eretmocerus hayati]|uniref:Uncharacterized protein n=1 Tax=Eretmocerus hayati TaxID=131215 RepID=A0ACC2NDB6_9HYME|nr:hypothetical protein QAD02_000396 [Eretmocerus hayati]
MAPTKKNSPSKNPVKKRAKKVMDIATKLKILDLLRDGEKIINLARRFEVNESTIRSIRDNQEAIRAASANSGVHGKFTKINRKKCVVKMENLLIVWMQDMIQKKIPLSGAAIKEQALIFFEHVKEKHFKDSVETFSASRGWFDRFRERFSLRSISFTELVEKNQVTVPSDSVLQEVVQSTINVAQEIGGEGFSDMQDSDVLSMVSTDRNQLTASDIEEILEDAEGNRAAEKNVEESPEPALSIRILSQIISTVQNAIDDALAQDPILTRSLKFKLDCEQSLATEFFAKK